MKYAGNVANKCAKGEISEEHLAKVKNHFFSLHPQGSDKKYYDLLYRLRRGNKASGNSAVHDALAFLNSCQAPDGRWFSEDGTRDGDLLVTSLVVLAYLEHGYTHRVGRYKKTVRAGFEFLKTQTDSSGKCSDSVLVQSVCISALDLLARVTRDNKYREVADRAIGHILAQQLEDGGFPEYGVVSNPKTTLFAAWALIPYLNKHAAQEKGAREAKKSIVQYAKRVLRAETDPLLVAMAGRTLIYLDYGRKSSLVKGAVNVMRQSIPAMRGWPDIEYIYFGTNFMGLMGGSPWHEWCKAMKEALIPNQGRGSHVDGSWEPVMGLFSKKYGRVYTTAMCSRTLSLYYPYGGIPR